MSTSSPPYGDPVTLRLGPEESLLVAAAAGRPGPVAAGDTDWDRVVELAGWHRLLPLVHHHVTSEPTAPAPPEPVAARLKQAARESTARNLRLGVELDRALLLLEDEGIPVVLLKGAALLETVYAHPGLRPMGDLDLLVPRADVERAHVSMLALGYAVRGARLGRDDEWWLSARHHHLPLVKAEGTVMVELHHQLLVDRPEFDVAALWERSVPGNRPPTHRLPAAEDLLLHVAGHFALDRMNRGESSLGQLGDVVRIAHGLPIDWEALVARARDNALADRLFLALDAAALLGVPAAPPEVLASLVPASYTPRRGEQFVRHRVLNVGKSFPLEQLAGGRRRLFPGDEALELYVDGDEEIPSRARLHARRWARVARRALREVPGPVALARDIRLSRWMLSLRS
jgi:hypothetical protein